MSIAFPCQAFMALKYFHRSDTELLKKLEEEHEQLNSSLLALTTHFAQVRIVDMFTQTDEEYIGKCWVCLTNIQTFTAKPELDSAMLASEFI